MRAIRERTGRLRGRSLRTRRKLQHMTSQSITATLVPDTARPDATQRVWVSLAYRPSDFPTGRFPIGENGIYEAEVTEGRYKRGTGPSRNSATGCMPLEGCSLPSALADLHIGSQLGIGHAVIVQCRNAVDAAPPGSRTIRGRAAWLDRNEMRARSIGTFQARVPFTAVTRVRISLGTPLNQALTLY
jgi:hypothetical protein